MSQQPKSSYSYRATIRALVIVLFVIAALVLAGAFISYIPGALSDGASGVIGLLIAALLIGGVMLNRWFKIQRRLK